MFIHISFRCMGYLWLSALALSLGACTDSQFAGSTSASRAERTPIVDREIDVDSDTSRRDLKDRDHDLDGTRSPESDVDLGDTDGEIEIEETISVQEKLCESKDGKVNISLVFDNTASMKDREVVTVRDSALRFVEDLRPIALKDKAPEFNFSVVVFDDRAWIPSGGWTKIGAESDLDQVKSHISTAMNPSAKGSASVPDEGLALAKGLYEELGTNADKETHRNFVILYSDAGLEEDYTGPQAVAHATELANEFGVAVIAIVLGDIDINDSDERHFFDMAQPKTGIVSDNHKGQLMTSGSSENMQDFFAAAAANLLDDCE